MITERNMIFANPQAYRVFPNIGNPMNTGLVEKAVYTGHLLVADSSGTTKDFSNTDTIDFTGFTGYVDIDQFTDTGSVRLGRWIMPDNEAPTEGEKLFSESTEGDSGVDSSFKDSTTYTLTQLNVNDNQNVEYKE